MGRRASTRVSLTDFIGDISKELNYEVKQEIIFKVVRAYYKVVVHEISLGHSVNIGNLGYINIHWMPPHNTRSGTWTTGNYRLNFKWRESVKRLIRGSEYGDCTKIWKDEYEDGIVTENGIERRIREDEEFFDD